MCVEQGIESLVRGVVYKVLGAMPSFRPGRLLALESESLDATPLLSMGIDSDSSDGQAIGLKAFPEAVVTEPSVFARTGKQTFLETDSLEGSFYKPIDAYEGIHRFDPSFEWEAKEEKRLVRKIDFRICSWVCLMVSANKQNDLGLLCSYSSLHQFFALQLDRGNISQALSDNLLNGGCRKFWKKYFNRSHTNYPSRPQHDYQRLQHWTDNLLPMLLVCRASLSAHIEEGECCQGRQSSGAEPRI